MLRSPSLRLRLYMHEFPWRQKVEGEARPLIRMGWDSRRVSGMLRSLACGQKASYYNGSGSGFPLALGTMAIPT